MSISRIYAINLRYFYNFKHSYDRITDAFYWPALDLFLWGLTGYYVASINEDGINAVKTVITGMVFWIIVWRAQYEISINLLTELWDKNLINLFGAPLKFSEWIISVMIVGILKAILSFLFATILAYLLYHINILSLGWYILLFTPLLLLSGWTVGFVVASIIFRWGTKIQTLGWSLIWLFAPFAAVYYPLEILPSWAQIVAKALPASYVFEQIRLVVLGKPMDIHALVISLFLNILYITIALFSLKTSFTSLKKKGLAKLY